MANKTLILALVVLGISMILAAECPSSSKVLNCTPTCLHDSQCSAIGGKCCPNICNARSCAQSNQLGNTDKSSSGSNKYSGSSGGFCGNQKCSPYEKCDTDRSTKRQKCVRT